MIDAYNKQKFLYTENMPIKFILKLISCKESEEALQTVLNTYFKIVESVEVSPMSFEEYFDEVNLKRGFHFDDVYIGKVLVCIKFNKKSMLFSMAIFAKEVQDESEIISAIANSLALGKELDEEEMTHGLFALSSSRDYYELLFFLKYILEDVLRDKNNNKLYNELIYLQDIIINSFKEGVF